MAQLSSQEIIDYIKTWNPFCENITLTTIFAKMRFNRGNFHVICFGPPGSGKSRSTLELVQELKLGTEIILDNTTTDRGLWETFYHYPEQDIVLDECSTLLKNLKTQDMVKLAMEGKPLTWTKNNSSETTDPYEGNLIINANLLISDAVIDRSFVNKTLMNKKMSLEFNKFYINQLSNPYDYTPFIKYLKKVIQNKTYPNLTDKEIAYILSFVEERIKENDQETGYSRRIIIRMLSFYRHAKKLFSNLDEDVLKYLKPFAESYIINQRSPSLIENLLGDAQIEKPELVKKLHKEGGYTKRHARRIINREIELENLVLEGKYVSVGRKNGTKSHHNKKRR